MSNKLKQGLYKLRKQNLSIKEKELIWDLLIQERNKFVDAYLETGLINLKQEAQRL